MLSRLNVRTQAMIERGGRSAVEILSIKKYRFDRKALAKKGCGTHDNLNPRTKRCRVAPFAWNNFTLTILYLSWLPLFLTFGQLGPKEVDAKALVEGLAGKQK